MSWFSNRLRTPEFARRRRRLVYVKTALLTLLFSLVVGGGVYLVRHEKLQIRHVVVSGAEVVAPSELSDFALEFLSHTYLFIFPKSNVALYPRGALEAAVLKHFPNLKFADFSLSARDTLRLAVVERTPQALWCGENRLERSATTNCYFLDPEGYLYAPSPTFMGTVYVRFYGSLPAGEPLGQTFLSVGEFTDLLRLAKELRGKGVVPAEIAIADTDVELYLEDETKVLFTRQQKFERVLDNLLSALSAEGLRGRTPLRLEYIDLRFGNKVYYKERGQSATTSPALE